MRRSTVWFGILLAPTLATSALSAQDSTAVVEELQRLNGAVERLTLLMERLVDERRIEALQRQLAIENERLAPLEARMVAARDAIADLRSEEAELARQRELLERQKVDYTESVFQSMIGPKIEEVDARRAEIQVRLAERERELRDAEAETLSLRERESKIAGEIDARLGLAD